MGVAMAAAALASAASGMTVAAPRKAMAYNKLGSSDLMVSSCCLGTRASSKVPLPTAAHGSPCGHLPHQKPARFAPWNQRGEPRRVGALWRPPQVAGVTTAWPSAPLDSARVRRLRLLGARLPAPGCQA